MKRNRTWLYLITAVFLAFSIVIIAKTERNESLPFSVSILDANGAVETVRCWRNEEGVSYLFLPSYAELGTIEILPENGKTVALDGQSFECGIDGSNLCIDKIYDVTIFDGDREHSARFSIRQSQNVPTMYIDTESGNMDYIHAKKGNQEKATVRLYSPSGILEYSGAAKSIKGRGNTTWDGFEKKPYSLELEYEADLLQMGSAQNWVLFSNAGDPSQIRNKMVFDFAEEFGLAYSPSAEWVDVYLNGAYAGLYLLSERNEIQQARVDISLENGVLVSKENADHLMSKDVPKVVTEADQAFRIHTTADEDMVLAHLQSVENAIMAEDGIDAITGKHWQDLIDLDSWVQKYLIEEFFGNIDAGHASQYYYWDVTEGKVYAGPVWDYDNAVLESTVNVLFANQREIKSGVYSEWNYALYQKPEFRQRVRELFETRLTPLLDTLIEKRLPGYFSYIEKANRMDKIRWSDHGGASANNENYFCAYLTERQRFLSSVFSEETEYCLVRFNLGNGVNYLYYAVEKGTCLKDLPVVDVEKLEAWYYEDTQQAFDPDRQIMEDIAVAAKWNGGSTTERKIVRELVPILLISGMFVVVLVWNVVRSKKEMENRYE